jgi:exosortase
VFAKVRADYLTGFSLLLPAAFLGAVTHFYSRTPDDSLSVEIAALVVLWIAGFALCYGTHALRAACFPLLFLMLMIPIPDLLIEKVIFSLQTGSAGVSYGLFKILNVPVFKEGFVFILPTINIEIAKECSGIRSSVALLITTLLAGDFVLRSAWRKSLLVLSAVPILILKNGLRIVTLSLLSIYVDPRFLDGWLHTSGGIVFYSLALLSVFPIILLLKRGEVESIGPVGGQVEHQLAETGRRLQTP